MILLIEDDKDIASAIVQYFQRQGLSVTYCDDGAEALLASQKAKYQLIILDLMLPHVDGFTILKTLRKNSGIPVFIISAKSQTTDLVRSFSLGADDYIVKPLSLEVLLARVQRKLQGSQSQCITLDELKFWPQSLKIARGKDEQTLTKKEALLLSLFVSRPGHVFSREQIITAVWENDYDGHERSVDNLIVALRKKLGKQWLVSVRGVGYKLSVPR